MSGIAAKKRGAALPIVAILVIAVVLRIACAWRCALGYDEVFVVGVGLDEATRSLRDWLVEVPARRSNAITPLWWWLQSLPPLLTGRVSLFAMRAVSILVGVAGLWLTWRIARRRIGHGPGALLLLLAGMNGVLAFTDARAEYVESLLVAAALPAACLVGDQRRLGLKAALWAVLPFTHLGKGLFLLTGLVLAELVALALRGGRGGRALVVIGVSAAMPTVLWLLLANMVVFGDGPVLTDAGSRSSGWDALSALTLGYRETKPHMVARPFDAAQLYLDAYVWPAASVMLVPLLAGLGALLVRPRHGSQAGGAPDRLKPRTLAPNVRLGLALLPWILLGAGYVIASAKVGARFHLLYLPAAWVAGSIGLWRLRHANWRVLAPLGGLWLLHVAWAASVSKWLERAWSIGWFTVLGCACVAAAIATVWALTRGRRAKGHQRLAITAPRWLTPMWLGLSVCVAPMLLIAGPLHWGPGARFEPMATAHAVTAATDSGDSLLARLDAWRGGDAAYPPADDRTLYLALAHYFLTASPEALRGDDAPRNAGRAVHYARLQTRAQPDDGRGWFYLGLTLQDAGASVEAVRTAWERAYELQPSKGLERRLRELR